MSNANMTQHQHYQQAKAAREGEKLAKMAKENGLFTKQDVHNIIASAMVEFLNHMIYTSPKVFEIGNGYGGREVQVQLNDFISTNKLDAHETDHQWASRIEKD